MLGAGQTQIRHEYENGIVDGKKILAEFNWNAAYDPYDYGCYYTNGVNSNPVSDWRRYGYRVNLATDPVCAGSGINSATSGSAPMTLSSGDSGHGQGPSTYAQVTHPGG